MKIIYENCGVNNYMKEDHRSYRRNFAVAKRNLKKIFDLLSYNSYFTMYYYHYLAIVERFKGTGSR